MDEVASKSVMNGNMDGPPADLSLPGSPWNCRPSCSRPPSSCLRSQADAQFAIKNVTVLKTKFYHRVTVLSQEVAAQFLDLIWSSPAINAYEVWKRGRTLSTPSTTTRGLRPCPASHRRPETFSSDEPDTCSPSGWLQTGFHPAGLISTPTTFRCAFPPSPGEGFKP